MGGPNSGEEVASGHTSTDPAAVVRHARRRPLVRVQELYRVVVAGMALVASRDRTDSFVALLAVEKVDVQSDEPAILLCDTLPTGPFGRGPPTGLSAWRHRAGHR